MLYEFDEFGESVRLDRGVFYFLYLVDLCEVNGWNFVGKCSCSLLNLLMELLYRMILLYVFGDVKKFFLNVR